MTAAFEFEAQVRADGTLALSPEVAQQLPAGLAVRVILLADADRIEELEFMGLSAEAVLRDDTEEDAAYDRYDELSSRRNPPG